MSKFASHGTSRSLRHRWLIPYDRAKEAVQIIADLEDTDTSDAFVQLQMSEIQYTVEYERANSVSFSGILRGRAHEKAQRPSAV